MTSYHIYIGYNPMQPASEFDMWEALKQEARSVANSPYEIEKEARRLGAPDVSGEGCCKLDDYAANYAWEFGTEGHPVKIQEALERHDRQVIQFASTSCEIKYHVRRAYARLLVEAMHKRGIEVCLSVG